MTSSVSLLFAERPQDCIKKALALLRFQLAVKMFFVTQAIQGASERSEERQFIICEKSEIKRRQDVEVISVGFKTAASAKAFAKKLVGKLHPEGAPFLDFWEEDGKNVWNWKDERTGGASQVFKSEKGALEAWRRNRLRFTKLLD